MHNFDCHDLFHQTVVLVIPNIKRSARRIHYAQPTSQHAIDGYLGRQWRVYPECIVAKSEHRQRVTESLEFPSRPRRRRGSIAKFAMALRTVWPAAPAHPNTPIKGTSRSQATCRPTPAVHQDSRIVDPLEKQISPFLPYSVMLFD